MAQLPERIVKTLNGDDALSSPMGTLAAAVLLGDRLNAADLQLAAIGAENTDAQMPLRVLGGLADAGTWTQAITAAGVRTVTRTAATPAEGYWMQCPLPIRTATGKGRKVTGVRVAYSIGTAIVDDVLVQVYRRTLPANGAAPAAPTLLAGSSDAHYDTAHNTAAERNALGDHTLEVTIPDAAYLGANEELLVRFVVDGSATGVAVLKDARLLLSETLVDLA